MNDPGPHNRYSITHEIREGYLYINVNGDEISYEIARAYWDQIIELRRATRSDRVLVEKEIPHVLPTYELFRLGSELAAKGLERAKVALCDRFASEDETVFSENVMANRGLNGKAFRSTVEAESWLLSS